jgi:hypothetical protein
MQGVEQNAVREAIAEVPAPVSHTAAFDLRSNVAALEAVRPSVATGSAAPAPVAFAVPVVALSEPEASLPDARDTTARRPRVVPTAPRAKRSAPPRANRALVAFLLLFVIASLGASGLLLAHVFVLR